MSEFELLHRLRQEDPAEFQRLMTALKDKVVRLHPAQQEVWDSPARFKVLNAGRRTGKTVLAARTITAKCRQPNQMTWWVAPTYKIVKRGYAAVLRQLPDGVLTHTPPPDTHFDAGRAVILRFKNGSRMEFYSAERPEGMLGEGVDFAVLDEAARLRSAVWEETVRPTLMDRGGTALLISTPRGRNWFWRAYNLGQDPGVTDWGSWTFPTSSNPYIADSEIEDMRNTLPTVVYEQEVLAKFVASGSSVFLINEKALQDNMLLDNHFVEGCPPVGHVVLGIDLAQTTDWTVLYGARSGDRKNVYFDRFNNVAWSEQRERIKRAVRQLILRGATAVTLVMDEGNAGKPIVEAMEEDGYDVIGINFTGLKVSMVKLLGKDLEDAKAFILSDARINEFESYEMGLTPAGKYTFSAPSGEHDDVVSAKMLSHWGMINEGVPGVTVLSGDDSLEVTDADEWDDLLDDAPDDVVVEEIRPDTAWEMMQRSEVWH